MFIVRSQCQRQAQNDIDHFVRCQGDAILLKDRSTRYCQQDEQKTFQELYRKRDLNYAPTPNDNARRRALAALSPEQRSAKEGAEEEYKRLKLQAKTFRTPDQAKKIEKNNKSISERNSLNRSTSKTDRIYYNYQDAKNEEPSLTLSDFISRENTTRATNGVPLISYADQEKLYAKESKLRENKNSADYNRRKIEESENKRVDPFAQYTAQQKKINEKN
jgi:hypothetical protein